MPLSSGTRLGPYEILAPLGAGGMGEVYRANDTRLDRTVAVKILPSHLSSNSDFKQRFEREARAISKLSHPNICGLYDVGSQDGVEFLVMEFLEGETLAQRLTKGVLPTDVMLRYAIQIADALDKAHRQGIVHRDLKPGNIMLTKSGVKLLDFGLAKLQRAIVSESTHASIFATEAREITAQGTILGTVQYMAPEQLEGKEADARTDIFAFGSVLYEMATGKKAFSGNSQASLISAILKDEPAPISKVQPLSPDVLDRVVKTCLAKDAEERFQNVHDLKIELSWIATAGSQPAIASMKRERSPLLWIVSLSLLIAGFAAGYWIGREKSPSGPAITTRSILQLPPDARLSGWASPIIAFSADGKKIAYVAEHAGLQQLYLQHLDRDLPQIVPGSEDAEGPFFSPDSEWLAFAVGVSARSGIKGELKKFSLSSGLTQSICDTGDYFGGSWGEDGTIVFTGADYKGLWRVSEAGGKAEHFGHKWKVDGKEVERGLMWPQFIPGSKKAVVIDGYAPHGYGIAIVDIGTHELKHLGIPATFARYTNSGHLIYTNRDASLMAVPFDLERMETAGPSVALMKNISLSGNDAGVFTISDNGSLIYLSGYLRGSGRELLKLIRIGQKGEIQDVGLNSDLFDRFLSISPDSRKLAVATWDGSLWVHDIQRKTRIKIVDGYKTVNSHPLWTPDGLKVAYSAFPSAGSNLFWVNADGRGTPELLVGDIAEKHPVSWTPDGKFMLYEWFGDQGSRIYVVQPETKAEPSILLQGQSVRQARISRDGKWIAYASNETGTFQVYTERFPERGQKVQISLEGGNNPHWSLDGRNIIYRNGARFMIVSVTTTNSSLDAGYPELLFEAQDIVGFDMFQPTGEFFALQRVADTGIQTRLHLVTNWFPELQRLAPASTK